MTYTSPQLTLIGQATGLVLVKQARDLTTTFDGLIAGPKAVSYDAHSLLEAEW